MYYSSRNQLKAFCDIYQQQPAFLSFSLGLGFKTVPDDPP
jgi:hypothetical protein